MALLFNIQAVEKAAGTSDTEFLRFMWYWYINKVNVPDKYVLARRKAGNVAGSSFLLNPRPLFLATGLDAVYLVQYIKLAARRDYSLYRTHKYTALPISYFPDLNRQKIQSNPLLKVVNNEILFKYEELYNGKEF